MTQLFIYIIVFALLYGTYRWLLKSSGNFTLNRIVLLSIPVLSSLSALIEIPVEAVDTVKTILPEVSIDGTQAKVESTPISTGVNFLSIYWALTAGVALLFLVKWIRSYMLRDEDTAHSFFNRIHVSNSLSTDAQKAIYDHEMVHAQKLHSLDVIFSELINVFTWINPLNYWWKKDIKLNHEFEADAIASEAHPEYATILVSQALQVDHLTLVHSFNKSNLKQRLIMMKSKKKNSSVRHYLLFAAVAISSVGICALQPNQALTIPSGSVEPTGDGQTTQAEFPGGQQALMDFMVNNVKYPEEAKKDEVEGKVFVKFTINEKGKVTNVSVAKSAHKLLDDEAVRVVKSMPAWKPAKKDGKAVASEMALPVLFKLK